MKLRVAPNRPESVALVSTCATTPQGRSVHVTALLLFGDRCKQRAVVLHVVLLSLVASL
jgi:hypothetical protein